MMVERTTGTHAGQCNDLFGTRAVIALFNEQSLRSGDKCGAGGRCLGRPPRLVIERSCPGEWAVVRHAYVVGVATRAVLATPLSGPLASFGRGGASALALWAERSGVSLEVIDAHPSAASAIRAAEASRPDVVFGPYGSGPALAAAAASKGVVWNHGGATARLARPAYPGVVNVESPAYRYLAAVLETLAADGLGEGSEVVIIHFDTGFGREVAEGAAVAARRLGLLLRSVSFRPARVRDVLAQLPAADVLLSAGSFDDDVAIAEWASERRWRAVGLGAAGVDELRDAIGDRVEGLCGPCQWFDDDGTDDPADGPNSEWFSHCY